MSSPVPVEDSVNGVPSECPMSCCIPGQAGKQAAISGSVVTTPQLAVCAELHPVTVVFAATGHSSHTDRGPPAA